MEDIMVLYQYVKERTTTISVGIKVLFDVKVINHV